MFCDDNYSILSMALAGTMHVNIVAYKEGSGMALTSPAGFPRPVIRRPFTDKVNLPVRPDCFVVSP